HFVSPPWCCYSTHTNRRTPEQIDGRNSQSLPHLWSARASTSRAPLLNQSATLREPTPCKASPSSPNPALHSRSFRLFLITGLQKRRQLVPEDLPRRFFSQKDMVSARERNKLGAGNLCCQNPAFFRRGHAVAVAVEHDGRRLQRRQQRTHIDFVARL